MTDSNILKKNEKRVLDITALASGGAGVARIGDEQGGRVVFVERGLPGQRVLARITLVKKRFAKAEVLDVVEQTPHAVDAQCPHFGRCGGCSWQDLDYPEQLRWKQTLVRENLERIGKLKEPPVQPTLPSPKTYGFRNKMEFAFSPGKAKGEINLGLHEPGSANVLNVEGCLLMSDKTMDVVAEVRRMAGSSKARSFDPEYGSGFWRHLVLRESAATGSCIANIITSPGPEFDEIMDGVARRLLDHFPHISCVLHSLRTSTLTVAQGETIESVYAREEDDPGLACLLNEPMGELNMSVSAESFFQTNTMAAQTLYSVVTGMAERVAGDGKLGEVWDVYCGVGGIALSVAGLCAGVKGFDNSESAIADAQANAEDNEIANCEFLAGDALALMREDSGSPELVILDPPRSGLHPDMVGVILEKAPKAVIYVSCDPATQARDLALLSPVYDLVESQPVDMFPHSPHVENVALLIK